MFRFGLDIGGSKLEGAVLDAADQVVFRERIATEADGGADHVLDRLEMLYRRMVAAVEGRPHVIGVGAPGSASPHTGRHRNSNTLVWNGLPLAELIQARLGKSIVLENDANCFALAEARLGAGQGAGLVFGVIMGTGCGGGLVIDGKVRSGRNGIAGEWGHMSIDPAGPDCYCGQRGCVETMISGSGIERRYAALAGQSAGAQSVFDAWRRGDTSVEPLMSAFFASFGRALANVIDIVDPDVVVLGGGLSNVPELLTRGVQEVRSQVFSDALATPITKNRLGDSAGVIGAALLCEAASQRL